MKKVLSILVVFFVGIVLVSCARTTYEIAMITDEGTINDKSFNQGTWEGIDKYDKENDDVKAKYYKPKSKDKNDYLASIKLAVRGGAKVVVTPGFYFENAIYEAQTLYPEVKFIIIDGAPHNGDYKYDIKNNTFSIMFKEEQAGFLAGYAVVKDGKTKLGFMGGQPVPAVQRFGIGWVAGAYYAAKENNLADFKFETSYYTYLNSFAPEDSHVSRATSWFSNVDVIHAAAGGAGNSVMTAIGNRTNKWVVGVDVDQKDENKQVITSAMKELGISVYNTLKDIYANDKFPGGTQKYFTTKDKGVGISSDFTRFTTFTKAQYDTLYTKLNDETVVVPSNDTELIAFIKTLEFSGLNDAYYTSLSNVVKGTN